MARIPSDTDRAAIHRREPRGAAKEDLTGGAQQPPEIDDELTHALIAFRRLGGERFFNDGAESRGGTSAGSGSGVAWRIFSSTSSPVARLERMPVRE